MPAYFDIFECVMAIRGVAVKIMTAYFRLFYDCCANLLFPNVSTFLEQDILNELERYITVRLDCIINRLSLLLINLRLVFVERKFAYGSRSYWQVKITYFYE